MSNPEFGPGADWEMTTQGDQGTVYDTQSGQAVDGWVSGGAEGYYADDPSENGRFWQASRINAGGYEAPVGQSYHPTETSAAQALYDRHRATQQAASSWADTSTGSHGSWPDNGGEWDGGF